MAEFGASTYGETGYGLADTEVRLASGRFDGAGTFEAFVSEVETSAGAFSLVGEFTATYEAYEWPARAGVATGVGTFTAEVEEVPVFYRSVLWARSLGFDAFVSYVRPSPPTVRWTLVDTASGESWTMPINPDSMTSPLPGRELKFAGGYRKDQRVRAFSVPRGPIEWEFGGVIRSKSHYDRLTDWAEKSVAVDVTDHLGRTFRVFLSEFNPTDRRPTPRAEWRLRYTMKALILERVG